MMFGLDPRELIARADALMTAVREGPEDRPHGEVRADQADALEAYRFAAVLLAADRRTDAIDTVVELRARVRGWESDWSHMIHVVGNALGALIARAGPDAPAVVKLATSAEASERLLVAEHVPLATPEGVARVAALLGDADPDVREAARRRLPSHRTPWWSAAFSQDPLPFLAPGQESELEPVLRAIVEHFESGEGGLGPLLGALAELPTPLLFDVATRSFAADRGSLALAGLVAARPGGTGVAWELLAGVRWLFQVFRADAIGLLAGQSPEENAEIALRFIDLLLEAEAPDDDGELGSYLARQLVEEWPLQVDPSALVDRVRAHPDSDHAEVLLGVIARSAELAAPWAARLLEERLTEAAEATRLFGYGAAAVIAAAPASVVRPFAERGLAVAAARTWAVAELLGRCHDPQHDPPVGVLARTWAEDESLSAAVRATRPELITDWLLARLRRGEASLADVSALRRRDLEAAPRRRRRTTTTPVSAPVEAVALTRDDWAEIRRVRTAALAAGQWSPAEVASSLGPEPWTAEDWAAVDRVFTQHRHAMILFEDLLLTQHGVEAIPRLEHVIRCTPSSVTESLVEHRMRIGLEHGLELAPPQLLDDDDLGSDDDEGDDE